MDDKYKLHGAFSWCEILTSDLAGAKTFYRKLFNWDLEPAGMPGTDYTLVKYGGEQMGGMMTIPAQAQGMPPAWGIYVTVDDVDATARLAAEIGGKLCMGPQDIPGVGRFCVIQDPQGAMISLITYSMNPA
jgi:hypothetical protein